MQVSFNGGVLDAGQSMTVQTAVNKVDWSNYHLNNDYSFNNDENICTYIDDELVSGKEPAASLEDNTDKKDEQDKVDEGNKEDNKDEQENVEDKNDETSKEEDKKDEQDKVEEDKEEPINISVVTNGQLEAGETICAVLSFDDLHSIESLYSKLSLAFNPDVYQVKSIERGEMCTDLDSFSFMINDNDGQIVMIFSKDSPIKREKCFARIYLKVKDTYKGTTSDVNLKADSMDISLVEKGLSGEKEVPATISFTDKTEHIAEYKNIKIQVLEDKKDTSNVVNPKFKITNKNPMDFDLSKLSLKYYYSEEGTSKEKLEIISADKSDGTDLTSNVNAEIVKFPVSQCDNEYADSYIKMGFSDGILKKGESAYVSLAISKEDGSNYNRANDYSFGSYRNVDTCINDVFTNKANPKMGSNEYCCSVVINAPNGQVVDNKVVIPIEFLKLSDHDESLEDVNMSFTYDKDKFEVESVEPGELCPNPKYTFVGCALQKTGDILLGFLGSNSEEVIDKCGTFAYVTLKPKDPDNIDLSERILTSKNIELAAPNQATFMDPFVLKQY